MTGGRSTFEIREARPEEWDEAGRVTAQAYEEFAVGVHDDELRSYIRRIADVRMRADRTLVLVVRDGDLIIGSATLELEGRVSADAPPLEHGEVHLRMVGIAPNARGRRAGRALMDACIEVARARACTHMTLHTTSLITAAQHMYESLGFQRGPDEQIVPGLTLLSYSRTL